MERRIAAVDAAREQDKKEIVERLSKNVSAAMAQMSRPSTPTRSTAGGSKTGASTAKPSGPQKMYEHTVAAGDTLSAIASAYHASASSIIAANNLKDPGHLKVGQKLLIPAP